MRVRTLNTSPGRSRKGRKLSRNKGRIDLGKAIRCHRRGRSSGNSWYESKTSGHARAIARCGESGRLARYNCPGDKYCLPGKLLRLVLRSKMATVAGRNGRFFGAGNISVPPFFFARERQKWRT